MGVLKRDARFAHSHFLLYDQRRGGMRGGKAIQKLIFDLTRGKGGGSEGGCIPSGKT